MRTKLNPHMEALVELLKASIASDGNLPAPQGRTGLARVTEAAKFLGVSRPYVYKLIRHGEIPTKRIGSAVRIPWVWLEAQAAEPQQSAQDI